MASGVILVMPHGCAHLKVVSQPPDAEVSLLAGNSSQPKILGKTPYESDVSDIVKSAQGAPLVIQVRKTGYLTSSFLVPNLGGKLVVDAKLDRNPYYSFEDVNKIVRLSFLAERQILQKQYDDALKTSERLLELNENAAIVYQIRGVVKFFRGDLNGSRVDLMRCLELEADNAEVKNLLAGVEEKLGLSKSANSGAAPGGNTGQ
jgi:tetratricopeptide (TPR) repeat protein